MGRMTAVMKTLPAGRVWPGTVLLLALLAGQPAQADRQPCIARDARGDLLGWADYPHCLVDYRTQSTVRWLDDWFGHPDVDEEATAAVRAITEVVIDDEGELTPALRLRARLHLPGISKRLSLVFEDESQDRNRLLGQRSVNDSSLALRWMALGLERLRVETDIGVRSGPDLFVRARTSRSWALATDDQIRVSQMLRYGVDERLRSISELEYSHAFSDVMAGTLFYQFDYRQEDSDQGFDWARGGVLSRVLESGATLAVGVAEEGITRPWETTQVALWTRYRRSFLRDWLFYEVEPRLSQTRQRDWDALPSLTLRLEVHFGQHTAQAARARAARPDPVPADTEPDHDRQRSTPGP